MSSAHPASPSIPTWVQFLGWLVGVLLCIYGMLDGVAMWPYDYALVALLLLLAALICWKWPSRRRLRPLPADPPMTAGWHAGNLVLLAACSLGMSVWTARQLGDLPPAYHDEFSYLFQAKTFLAGRLWVHSHPTHPELFDQMHVLNDNGRMASRYFPGTGVWMVPFVALHQPYAGHWICSLLVTVLVYAAGYELQNARAGFFAGLLTALSPGMALFGNLLLAHQPALLGLSFFLWRMARLQRTGSGSDALGAGIGLTWAMLCRPMTAAGFALPFGIWTAWWLLRSPAPIRARGAVCLGFAVPLGLGFLILLVENAAITGDPWRSPYQMYTDIYTPRHVFGFNNVIRGEQQLGPKVIDGYDRWAVNLTPDLAAENVSIRLANSLLLIWDLLPLAMIACVWLLNSRGWEWRQRFLMLAIVSLHAVHIPYWFAGIMGWHYVFETIILWTLLAGCTADGLLRNWRQHGKSEMIWWFYAFALMTLAANLVSLPGIWHAKLSRSLSEVRYPRKKQAEFQGWVKSAVGAEPALVLVAPHRDQGHLDYVVNEPGLKQPVLMGRYLPGKTDVRQIARDFADRAVFLCEPDKHILRRVETAP